MVSSIQLTYPARYPLPSTADSTGARLDEDNGPNRVLPRVKFDTEEARQAAIQEFIAGSYVSHTWHCRSPCQLT
jgi:hypothetical protein